MYNQQDMACKTLDQKLHGWDSKILAGIFEHRYCWDNTTLLGIELAYFLDYYQHLEHFY